MKNRNKQQQKNFASPDACNLPSFVAGAGGHLHGGSVGVVDARRCRGRRGCGHQQSPKKMTLHGHIPYAITYLASADQR